MPHMQAGRIDAALTTIAMWLIHVSMIVVSQVSLANQKAREAKQTARVPPHRMKASVNASNGRTALSYRPLD
jgi:hypothetical protein